MAVKKIVILGPESTGKSTLCDQLASHFKTVWVPEFARSYLHEHGIDYSYDDLLTIAKGQIALEDKLVMEVLQQFDSSPAARLTLCPIFIDTNMYVMKVWCEFVFGKCHDWILHQIARRHYDLYFLCDIDLPWVKDELREYPDLESRQRLMHTYEDIMINQDVPWVHINGSYHQRFVKAVAAVDHLLEAQ